jgi:hypothetical protein
MKKPLVLTLTALAIAASFLASLSLKSRSPDHLAMRQAAYRGLFEEAPSLDGRMADNEALAVMASPSAPMMKDEAAEPARKRARGERGPLGLSGEGAGGGGFGAAPAAYSGSAVAESPEGGGAAAPTRAWFPETFLFEPLVVTDAQGNANVPVKVPDRLTTWRVLALAHSRAGGQAGAVASFLGTLPTYVEPVTPPVLFAGDVVRLPIQLVNTTDAALSRALTLSASNATLSSAGGAVQVPASGSVVQYVTLTTGRPGAVTLRAGLGGADAVEKSIAVQPAGQRQLLTRGGTLAAPRSFELQGWADALPGTESVRLRVFPGALGLLRSELSAAPGRGGVADDGYLLHLLGEAPALLRKLGADPKEDTLRELTLIATQRVMRHARAPSVDAATLLAEAALAHPDSPVLARLGERLAAQVSAAQRADGTCQGGDGWTLQRLLVTTADCVRAAKASPGSPAATQRATVTALKASGAFERNRGRVADAYTAAAMLASGALPASVADELRALVKGALKDAPDGAKFLPVDEGVVRSDGAAPSTAEATALAVLALEGDAGAPLADLGTHLLSTYSPAWGWGDGRANLVCLRAVVQLFKEPVPAGVTVTLERDGVPLATGALSAAALTEVLTLDADATGSAGAHRWTVKAEPPVPGLGYSLALVAFTPWKPAPEGGVQLTTRLPEALTVGRAADVALTASLPSGVTSVVEVSLPAGVQADTPSLDALVSSGAVLRYEAQDGQLRLHVPPLAAGAVFSSSLRLVPTLAGTLHAAPSSVMPAGRPQLAKAFAAPPWVVRER